MYYTHKVLFFSSQGYGQVKATIELRLGRQFVVVRVFADDSRTIMLVPEQPFRFEVRSAHYQSNPIEVANAVIERIHDLSDEPFIQTPAKPGLYWALGTFDYPQVERWVGWTRKARRIMRAHAEMLKRSTVVS